MSSEECSLAWVGCRGDGLVVVVCGWIIGRVGGRGGAHIGEGVRVDLGLFLQGIAWLTDGA